ncbi:hypothetical protein HAX54_016583, partial [Datura stramonium]|nr:hypothetical protein [Datura stramonium]
MTCKSLQGAALAIISVSLTLIPFKASAAPDSLSYAPRSAFPYSFEHNVPPLHVF